MAQSQTPVISTTIADNFGSLTLSCVNGEAVTLHVSQLTPEIGAAALLHGLKQKLVDAAAISRNPDTGKPATPDDKWAAVMEVFERITSAGGTWNKTREGGSGGSGGLLFRALVRLYPAKTQDQLREYLDGKTDKDKAALRANPKVAAVIEQIKAENAKASGAGVDSDELLDELND